jgi:hypothetical protein
MKNIVPEGYVVRYLAEKEDFAPMSDDKATEWAQTLLHTLTTAPSDERHEVTYIMSGDTMVVGIRDDNYIRLYHTKIMTAVSISPED